MIYERDMYNNDLKSISNDGQWIENKIAQIIENLFHDDEDDDDVFPFEIE